jgi:DMSO/TMAO reductase YedYZ molybdopterin-dependent catalytic subunit
MEERVGLPERPEDAELVPRRTPERGAPIGRRIVLGGIGLGALGILFGAKVQDGMERVLRPVTMRDRTGLSDLLPATGRFRYYSVTGRSPGVLDADYRLTVGGLVDTPVTLDLHDLRERLPQVAMTRDFQCVTGWRVHDVAWQGVRLRDVLKEAGVSPTATRVAFRSFDGTYTESLTLEEAMRDDVIVAHEMLGKPVTRDHGGPVRLYVAPMYGYKSIKWLGQIELTDRIEGDGGFWEDRGYELEAWIGHSNGRDDEPVG